MQLVTEAPHSGHDNPVIAEASTKTPVSESTSNPNTIRAKVESELKDKPISEARADNNEEDLTISLGPWNQVQHKYRANKQGKASTSTGRENLKGKASNLAKEDIRADTGEGPKASGIDKSKKKIVLCIEDKVKSTDNPANVPLNLGTRFSVLNLDPGPQEPHDLNVAKKG